MGKQYWTNGGQDLSLGQGCNNKGTVMHEMMHAIGFWHEQSRPDRNQYVEVLWENIVPGRLLAIPRATPTERECRDQDDPVVLAFPFIPVSFIT